MGNYLNLCPFKRDQTRVLNPFASCLPRNWKRVEFLSKVSPAKPTEGAKPLALMEIYQAASWATVRSTCFLTSEKEQRGTEKWNMIA